jgi:hypothetical protein
MAKAAEIHGSWLVIDESPAADNEGALQCAQQIAPCGIHRIFQYHPFCEIGRDRR